MTPDPTLLTEVTRQAPILGAVLLVGWFGFTAYQKIVARMIEMTAGAAAAIAASTAAINASTITMQRMTESLDSVAHKVVRELANREQMRLLREEAAKRGIILEDL